MIFAAQLEIDWWGVTAALVLGGLFILLYLFQQRFRQPSIAFSKTAALSGRAPSLRLRLHKLPQFLCVATVICWLIALADPHITGDLEELKPQNNSGANSQQGSIPVPVEGVGIYLVLDQSGSMRHPISQGSIESRLDILKRVTKDFIAGGGELDGRQQDLLGLVTFARTAQVQVPLTFDHEMLIDELEALAPIEKTEHQGTAIGYAIYRTCRGFIGDD